MGPLQESMYNARAESGFTDRIGPKFATTPYKAQRLTEVEVTAHIESKGLDPENRGIRKHAARELREQRLKEWQATGAAGTVSTHSEPAGSNLNEVGRGKIVKGPGRPSKKAPASKDIVDLALDHVNESVDPLGAGELAGMVDTGLPALDLDLFSYPFEESMERLSNSFHMVEPPAREKLAAPTENPPEYRLEENTGSTYGYNADEFPIPDFLLPSMKDDPPNLLNGYTDNSGAAVTSQFGQDLCSGSVNWEWGFDEFYANDDQGVAGSELIGFQGLILNEPEGADNEASTKEAADSVPTEGSVSDMIEDAMLSSHLEGVISLTDDSAHGSDAVVSPLQADADTFVAFFAAINVYKNQATFDRTHPEELGKRVAMGNSRKAPTAFTFHCGIDSCPYSIWSTAVIQMHQKLCKGEPAATKTFRCENSRGCTARRVRCGIT